MFFTHQYQTFLPLTEEDIGRTIAFLLGCFGVDGLLQRVQKTLLNIFNEAKKDSPVQELDELEHEVNKMLAVIETITLMHFGDNETIH